MKPGTLIIFSGLPGSGKSTLASKLASKLSGTYLRIDTLEEGLRKICKMQKIEGEGYGIAYLIAQENLRMGNIVIADSVNPWTITRKEWNNVAINIGAKFLNLEIICSNTEEHKMRVEKRKIRDPDFNHPSWQEVQKREYHPWKDERIVIDTSGKSEEESLKELLSILKI